MIQALRIVHGVFNAGVFIAFLYTAALGWRVRKARLSNAPPPIPVIRRHRGQGPILVVLAIFGYLVGFVLILIDTGRLLVYPAHLVVGTAIIILLIATYALSRRIKGPESPLRTPHFVLGILILALYVVQALLGLHVLLG